MGTRKAAIKNLKKALESPDIGQRGKGEITIQREKAREFYIDKGLKHLDKISDVQFAEAENPKNFNERRETINQLIGKPKESVDITTKGETINLGTLTDEKAIEITRKVVKDYIDEQIERTDIDG